MPYTSSQITTGMAKLHRKFIAAENDDLYHISELNDHPDLIALRKEIFKKNKEISDPKEHMFICFLSHDGKCFFVRQLRVRIRKQVFQSLRRKNKKVSSSPFNTNYAVFGTPEEDGSANLFHTSFKDKGDQKEHPLIVNK